MHVECPPRCNGAPTQAFLVCRLDAAGRRVLALQRWGLMQSWARDRAVGCRLINARSETVAAKPAFRAALRCRRRLVPANGWFEWRRTPEGKGPIWTRLAGGRPFSFAGLWEACGKGVPDGGLHDPDRPGRGGASPRARAPAGGRGAGAGPGGRPRRPRSGCRRRTRVRSSCGGGCAGGLPEEQRPGGRASGGRVRGTKPGGAVSI